MCIRDRLPTVSLLALAELLTVAISTEISPSLEEIVGMGPEIFLLDVFVKKRSILSRVKSKKKKKKTQHISVIVEFRLITLRIQNETRPGTYCNNMSKLVTSLKKFQTRIELK